MAPGSLAISGKFAEVFHHSRAPARSHVDRVLLFVNIPANKSALCDAARLLCVWLGAGRLNPRSVAYRLTGGYSVASAGLEWSADARAYFFGQPCADPYCKLPPVRIPESGRRKTLQSPAWKQAPDRLPIVEHSNLSAATNERKCFDQSKVAKFISLLKKIATRTCN
jgi:hypothetical protein